MTRKEQKKQEKFYLDSFLKNVSNLDEYQIIDEYGEQPDFIIESNNKKIGIEITNLFNKNGKDNSSQQTQMAKRDELLKIAQRNYLQRNANLYDFNFNFDLTHPIMDVRKTAIRLSKSIEIILKEDYRSEVFRLDDCPEVLNIHSNFEEYDEPKWRVVQVYDVPSINVNNLDKVIQQKKIKFKNYQRCDFQWLVIIIEFWDPAQDQDLNINGHEINSEPFDKIFVYKPATQEYLVF